MGTAVRGTAILRGNPKVGGSRVENDVEGLGRGTEGDLGEGGRGEERSDEQKGRSLVISGGKTASCLLSYICYGIN